MIMLIALAAATAATADPGTAVQRIIVPYQDLDLATRTGSAVLERRVRAAAMKICGVADFDDFPETRDLDGCHQVVMATARAQVAAAVECARKGRVDREQGTVESRMARAGAR